MKLGLNLCEQLFVFGLMAAVVMLPNLTVGIEDIFSCNICLNLHSMSVLQTF